MSSSKPPNRPQVVITQKQHKIGLISDLDKLSKEVDEEGHVVWKSLLRTGTLSYDSKERKVSVALCEKKDAITIKSGISRGSRGMELSELIAFQGNIYSVDDRTGIIYNVTKGKAVPWVILAHGDGNSEKGFKGEWMTRKDGVLYVGSHGKMIDQGKEGIDSGEMWIKKVKKDGGVEHIDWKKNYEAMYKVLDCPFPGSVIHEACVWSDVHQQWFFIPRKICKEKYDPATDYKKCSNVMLRCSEDFKNISIHTIGELKPTHGYSSFKFIPGTNDSVIVAIKSEEIGDSQKSFITAFTIDGEIIVDEILIENAKYEGLEFI